MRTTRARTLQALAIAAVLSLAAGCAGGPAQNPDTGPPAAAEKPTASETAGASETTAAPQGLPDPRSLRGVTDVRPIPAIVPVDSDPQVTLPSTVVGDDGAEVMVESSERIVTLDIYGTISQTLVGLGMGDRIVGRTATDTDPSLADAPLVTVGAHTVNLEAVMNVRPTLVLLDTTLGPANTQHVLRDAGIDVVVLDPDRGADLIDEQIVKIAAAVGAPEAGTALVERVNAELDAARQRIGELTGSLDDPMRMAVLYVRGTAGIFFLFGGDSAASELIGDLGGAHVAADIGMGETVPANAESLIMIDPEVLLVMEDGLESTGGVEGLTQRPGVAQTTAGMNQRVIQAPDSQLISFGPSYPAALEALADAVYLGG